MKKYALRKRGGKFVMEVIPEEPQWPENRRKFNHCGNCGKPFFVEREQHYQCKKCGHIYAKVSWRHEK